MKLPTPTAAVLRPPSAGIAMPADLVTPQLALPHIADDGRPLSKLGSPPEPNTPAAERDMGISLALIAQRTHDGNGWGRAMASFGGSKIWKELASNVAGDSHAAQALVGAALRAANTQAGVGKVRWNRDRPFQVDPSMHVIGSKPKGSSYPSGHSAAAFAAARVISLLDPALAGAAYGLANEVALSRIYVGAHFATDVIAGARLGVFLGDSVMRRFNAGELQHLVEPQPQVIAAA